MPGRTTLALFIVVAGLAGGALAQAQPNAFWCGTHLIRGGMAAADITRHCGAPDAREVLEEPIMARRSNGSTHQVGIKATEFWTYARGAGKFPARVTVEAGVATDVKLLSRE